MRRKIDDLFYGSLSIVSFVTNLTLTFAHFISDKYTLKKRRRRGVRFQIAIQIDCTTTVAEFLLQQARLVKLDIYREQIQEELNKKFSMTAELNLVESELRKNETGGQLDQRSMAEQIIGAIMGKGLLPKVRIYKDIYNKRFFFKNRRNDT